MAHQVAARLAGDEYQHLYAWYLALQLKMPGRNVRLVTVEDALAGSVDDVTVRHEPGTRIPDRCYQVKYHVDQRGDYSTESLIERKPGSSSLLEKFWKTWKLLTRQEPERPIELYLVSNWTWKSDDKLRSCFAGRDSGLTTAFFDATPRSAIGRLRQRWQDALGADEQAFADFARCLRFNLGFDSGVQLEERVCERMDNLGLQSDAAALKIAVGIVRDWIRAGTQQVTREDLERVLTQHDLYRPPDGARCVTVYLTTIKEQTFEIEPDYIIDWRDQFVGRPTKKGHALHDPAAWNAVLLPELEALEARINRETTCRLIRARGSARLSAWFAFGFTFSDVARYTIEVEQQGKLWRTDADKSANLRLTITSGDGAISGEVVDGEGATVAVGISVAGSLDADVHTSLGKRTDAVAALLLLRPDRELGETCLMSGGDAVALAVEVKRHLLAFVKHWSAHRLLLFYYGPLSGACFIGHRMNAVCEEIQIMERQQPGEYAPSFLLS
ncbi:MAG TPA: SAVED domain-containing protein [Herpetosiphonaceae bacterium]